MCLITLKVIRVYEAYDPHVSKKSLKSSKKANFDLVGFRSKGGPSQVLMLSVRSKHVHMCSQYINIGTVSSLSQSFTVVRISGRVILTLLQSSLVTAIKNYQIRARFKEFIFLLQIKGRNYNSTKKC